MIEQLLTEHLDTWTQAVETKSAAGRGSSKKLKLHGIAKLRELILELAVRGQLVPQDENDEPASVLLERIAAERERLVKEKKIKKPKKLPEISEDEKPFELPSGWAWARFPEISDYKPGKTPSTKNTSYWSGDSSGFPWVSIADLNDRSEVVRTNKRITPEAKTDVFKYDPVKAGTLLMSFKLTVGKISLLGIDAFHNEAIISILPSTGISLRYLMHFLPALAQAGKTKKAIMGNTLNASSLSLLLIPVPPQVEQNRIVAKVDELMALCDALEREQESSIAAHEVLVENLLAALTNAADKGEFKQAWVRVAEHFDTLFTTERSVDQLKQTILQLAVMGKLVEQDPTDEPAGVLLERIAAEKARLVKEKKIKKQKVLPEVSEAEKVFELPEGWEWCRLGHLMMSFSNGLYKQSKYYTDSGIPSLRMFNIQNGEISFIGVRRVELEKEELEQFMLESGDLLINRVNSKELVGKTAIIPDYNEPMVYESMNMRAKPVKRLTESKFINLLMRSPFVKESIFSLAKEAIGQASINQTQVASLVFPLPPLEEQKRIVTMVDQLMAFCDQLKVKIREAQSTQIQVASTLTELAS